VISIGVRESFFEIILVLVALVIFFATKKAKPVETGKLYEDHNEKYAWNGTWSHPED